MKREITAEEMAVIAQLASDYPDLHAIPILIEEQRRRIEDLQALTIGAASVQPKSIDDLLKLRAAKLVDDTWCRQRLGLEPAPAPALATATAKAENEGEGQDEGGLPVWAYRVRDRRVSG